LPCVLRSVRVRCEGPTTKSVSYEILARRRSTLSSKDQLDSARGSHCCLSRVSVYCALHLRDPVLGGAFRGRVQHKLAARGIVLSGRLHKQPGLDARELLGQSEAAEQALLLRLVQRSHLHTNTHTPTHPHTQLQTPTKLQTQTSAESKAQTGGKAGIQGRRHTRGC